MQSTCYHSPQPARKGSHCPQSTARRAYILGFDPSLSQELGWPVSPMQWGSQLLGPLNTTRQEAGLPLRPVSGSRLSLWQRSGFAPTGSQRLSSRPGGAEGKPPLLEGAWGPQESNLISAGKPRPQRMLHRKAWQSRGQGGPGDGDWSGLCVALAWEQSHSAPHRWVLFHPLLTHLEPHHPYLRHGSNSSPPRDY